MDIKSKLKTQRQYTIGGTTAASQKLGMSSELLHKTIHASGHELRSPIFVIRSYAHLLQKVQDRAKMNTGFAMIEEATVKMENLVGGLVALIDLYTQPVPTPESISSEKLVAAIEHQLGEFFVDESPNFTADFSGISEILFPQKYLIDLLVQLLDNAFRHNIGQKDLWVQLTAKEAEDGIVLTVSDNGKGIDLNNASNDITAPFYTYSDDESCVGLGLAKVSAIAQVTGCTSHLESSPGLGTHYQFKIPY